MHILIVDDHPLFSDGLKLLLLQVEPRADVACCRNGEQALQLVRRRRLDLVLLDWWLGSEPSGLELLQALRQAQPMARVVVVSAESDPALVHRCIEAGAAGFVSKSSTSAELIAAISHTARGGIALPAAALVQAPRPPARALAPGQAEGPAAAEGPSTGSPAGGSAWAPPHAGALLQPREQAFPTLTPRQLEVLGALARGLANKQIARELGISEGTVKQHVNAILFELGVSNRTEAVYLLARLGIGLG